MSIPQFDIILHVLSICLNISNEEDNILSCIRRKGWELNAVTGHFPKKGLSARNPLKHFRP
jgi:hypothetical protein